MQKNVIEKKVNIGLTIAIHIIIFCGCISDIRKTCRNYGKIPCNMALYSDSSGTVQFIWYSSTIGQQTEYHAESCYRSDCGSISYCICHSKHCT